MRDHHERAVLVASLLHKSPNQPWGSIVGGRGRVGIQETHPLLPHALGSEHAPGATGSDGSSDNHQRHFASCSLVDIATWIVSRGSGQAISMARNLHAALGRRARADSIDTSGLDLPRKVTRKRESDDDDAG